MHRVARFSDSRGKLRIITICFERKKMNGHVVRRRIRAGILIGVRTRTSCLATFQP